MRAALGLVEAIAALKAYNAKFTVDMFVWRATDVISSDFTALLPTELINVVIARERLERAGTR